MEVVVSRDVRARKGNLAKDVHANDGVDEEEHQYQQRNIWQRLQGLQEGPQERANAFTTRQQFDQTHGAEQAEEVDAESLGP